MHLWNIYKHRSWCYEKKMVLMYRYFNCVFTVLMYKLPDSFSSAFVYVDNFVLWINWKSQSRPTFRTVIVWYVWNVAHFDSNGCIVISFNFTLFYKCKSLILFFLHISLNKLPYTLIFNFVVAWNDSLIQQTTCTSISNAVVFSRTLPHVCMIFVYIYADIQLHVHVSHISLFISSPTG